MPLDQSAWKLGDSPDGWPRSRYSGVALRPGQMAVTIVVNWNIPFGHAFVVFEWYADEGPREFQRRHEIYDLIPQPTDEQRARGLTHVEGKAVLSWRARPAKVTMNTNTGFLPFRNKRGRELPAYFQSWLVPFADGWRARQAAVGDMASPPPFHYFELNGGLNCARWVSRIAGLAGIDVRHLFCRAVTVPKCLIRRAERVRRASDMWERRRAKSEA